MVYVKVPQKTHFEEGVDRKEFDMLKTLFGRHNYQFSFFGHDTATFFDVKDKDVDEYVSAANRYCMDRRELGAFVGLLHKLDAMGKLLNEQVMRLSSAKSVGY
jgi:hypothetical protein